jgi:hypothetical protein
MCITRAALVVLACSYGLASLGAEGRLHGSSASRSLAWQDAGLDTVEAYTPVFLPDFIPADEYCPSPPPDTECNLEYEPVTCDGCPYPNACIAAAALPGQDACISSPLSIDENGVGTYGELGLSNRPDCPKPDDAASCSLDFLPVKCDGCIFINSCAAQSASFDVESQCEPADGSPLIVDPPPVNESCPAVPLDATCSFSYEPVTCNGCEYSNLCVATAAFGGLNEVGCLGSPLSIDENGVGTYGGLGLSNRPDCPQPDDAALCSLEFLPLQCNGCVFINVCAAKSANFDVETECVSLLPASVDADISHSVQTPEASSAEFPPGPY